MKKLLYAAILFLTTILSIGCSEEDTTDTYKYTGMDTILVHAEKEYYFYPGTSIRSKNKGFVITSMDGRNDTIQTIEGFDDIYKEGTEYLIIVKVFKPSFTMPDLYGYRYKFVLLLEQRSVHKLSVQNRLRQNLTSDYK